MAEILERIPLTRNPAGDIFVEGSRVPLEVLVDAYNAGASPESLSLDYPGLSLGDIHAVILYYLRHRLEVDAYVTEQYKKADQARTDNRFGNTTIVNRIRNLGR